MSIEELKRLAEEEAAKPMTTDELLEERRWMYDTIMNQREVLRIYKHKIMNLEFDLAKERGESGEVAEKRYGDFVKAQIMQEFITP